LKFWHDKIQRLDATKKLMGALVRMKPKPHEEMKVGPKAKKLSSFFKEARFLQAKNRLAACFL